MTACCLNTWGGKNDITTPDNPLCIGGRNKVESGVEALNPGTLQTHRETPWKVGTAVEARNLGTLQTLGSAVEKWNRCRVPESGDTAKTLGSAVEKLEPM